MSAVTVNKNLSDSVSKDCSKFKIISMEIAALGASVGIKIVPFHNQELKHFSQLNTEARSNILSSLQIYLNVYKAVKAEGSSLLDSVRVIWNALSQLGYRPTSDLFSYIKSGNVIEIHDNRLVQVFRNLNFFHFCSYSLEELYCYNLHELYTRDVEFESGLMVYLKQLYSGEIKNVIKTELKSHVISELISKERLKITDDIHFMAPLFLQSGGSEPMATITIENARIEPSQRTSVDSGVAAKTEMPDNVYTFTPPSSSQV